MSTILHNLFFVAVGGTKFFSAINKSPVSRREESVRARALNYDWKVESILMMVRVEFMFVIIIIILIISGTLVADTSLNATFKDVYMRGVKIRLKACLQMRSKVERNPQ